MAVPENTIRNKTVDALARGLFEEASKYGLQQQEIIRFVNTLLQLSMQARALESKQEDSSARPSVLPLRQAPINSALPLTSEKISIRACDPSKDRLLLKDWLQDPEGQQFLRYRLTANTISLPELFDSTRHLLGIITLPDLKPIGCVAFLDYDRTQQKAELRKLIGAPEMRNKGYAKQATRLWINYGLKGLNLRKIYLNTVSNNIRNIRINEELGFSVEGILRNEVFLNGKHHDVIRMGLCSA